MVDKLTIRSTCTLFLRMIFLKIHKSQMVCIYVYRVLLLKENIDIHVSVFLQYPFY